MAGILVSVLAIAVSGNWRTARSRRKRCQRGTVYICPMHPDVRQDRPGSCPKCGMAFEWAPHHLTRWIELALATPVVLWGGWPFFVRARRLRQATVRNIRQNLLFAFAYNSPGVPIAAMSASSVSVIGNVLRLNRVEL